MDDKGLEIIINSRQLIEKYECELPHGVIVVHDPGSIKPNLPNNSNRLAEIYFEFNDIDKEILDLKIFTKDDAKAILSFVKLINPYIKSLYISCEAGISRSAAIGAALSILLKLPEKDSKFFTSKGRFYPNRFIYRTILETANEENFYAQ